MFARLAGPRVPHFRAAVLPAAALLLAACGGDSGGSGSPTAPETPSTSAACQARTTLDLQPGQRAALSADEAACFRLAPHASARYVLAGFDARAVESARGGPEAAPSGEPAYLLGDGSPVTPTAIPSMSRSAAADAPADLVVRRAAAADPADPFTRATPWREGERFTVRRKDGSGTATARVERIFGGRYVLAVVDSDASSHASRFVNDTEKGMEFFLREGAPLLERVFGAAPATSAGSGQMLIVLAAWNPDHGAGSAVTQADPAGGGVHTAVWLNLDVRPGVRDGFDRYDVASYRLKVLAHELTHAWQMRYAYDSQPAGPRAVSFGPAWAMEGTADLLAMDLVRRSLGVGLTANWDWRSALTGTGSQVTYALEPYSTRGRLAAGYFDAASFLRDVQLRLSRSGLAADEAMAAVARGAVEGWFGTDAAGVKRAGLAQRVRAVLGGGWEPADAVLLWTLTQAADDETSSADLNNPVYSHAADGEYAWQPAVDDFDAGRTAAFEVRRAPGSSFFVRIKDSGRGGTFSATSTVAATRWMIARVR